MGEARPWTKRVADVAKDRGGLGSGRAMMFVAQMSTSGGRLEKDRHVAFEYVRRAAEKDCVQASNWG